MAQKRTLDAFLAAPPKRRKANEPDDDTGRSEHPSYPFPMANLPAPMARDVSSLPARPGKGINDRPDLDLLHFQPYIPTYMANEMFDFLRSELPFYRVEYEAKRGGLKTHITTPRWTTVFGLDDTSYFDARGSVTDKLSTVKANDRRYDRYPPRPIPQCLDTLRKSTEAATGCKFNFCLVNYYASGADSISFHSDDERFLGAEPAIASFSLGARRDFLMKRRPPRPGESAVAKHAKGVKLTLGSGDMILMRGATQANWLHSIPKRTGKNQQDGGRINITFRKAMIKDGTENYYNYNVGSGPVYRWDQTSRQMVLWEKG
ncbi:DNA repair family protein [Metarhizium album ARSEF 1941]|uniref:DNA repair family protein n=1 Tax=Metarhizium album (strain ARSEF 1941) TaxID=1081103 RepID=A0A0B2WL13_METAS|nr:DNA repair family protein [Metarhizium album ARSEF 1941]KHN94172.1 DNA repair family protein [Metarhizium album ARSEF 1941]